MLYFKLRRDKQIIKSLMCDTFAQAEEHLKPDYTNDECILINELRNGVEIQFMATENWRIIERIKSKRIDSLEDTVSKTVKRVIHESNMEATAYEDGTFRIIETQLDYEQSTRIASYEGNLEYQLMRLGLITDQQYQKYLEEKRMLEDEIYKQQEQREFERLKKKLGK